jgi:hypothetical protein
MVTNDDGQDAYVTADPTLAQIGQRALPLYTLDRKDVLILDLYAELGTNFRLRGLDGARADEPMTPFIERVIAERAKYSAHDWRADGIDTHRGEYWYKCARCGRSDWIASYGTMEQLMPRECKPL